MTISLETLNEKSLYSDVRRLEKRSTRNRDKKKKSPNRNDLAFYFFVFSTIFLTISPVMCMIYNIAIGSNNWNAEPVPVGNIVSLIIGIIGGSLSTIIAFYFSQRQSK